MRRDPTPLLAFACALILLLACDRAVLFQGGQFAHRDGANFYEPLDLRVRQEWGAGRWPPLWDPAQNGGQPLLGSPMAAVVYPGKLVHALLPYAWAVRLYVVGHSALAFAGAWSLARSLGVSAAGAGVAGLSYAFGAPVLYQYSNPIYLVGAAWVPWGLREADRLLRLGRGSGLVGLAAVLAMQVLGGEPQSAYLTLLCAAGYAATLALRERPRPFPVWPVAAAVAAWPLATLAWAVVGVTVPGWVGPVWVPAVVGWGVFGVRAVRRARRVGSGRLGPNCAALAGAGGLALALAAVQVVPSAELTALSRRAGEGEASASVSAKFSVEPYRLLESFWPEVFGSFYPENRTWLQALPPANDRQVWEPSLYVGGLAAVLAVGAAGFRSGPAWRGWLTAVAAVGLAASFGRFLGPLWWAGWVPGLASALALGPHDPPFGLPRLDGLPADAAGSPYALLGALLPGFGLFRYPAKLLTFTALAVAVLAGAGWDDLAAGRSRRFARLFALMLAASVAGLVLASALRGPAVAFLAGRLPYDAVTGPPDPAAAWSLTQRSLIHAAAVYAAALALTLFASRRPGAAGAFAVVVMAADLGLANAGLVLTAPQGSFDAVPEAVRRIEAAEKVDPSPGPFRVHRLSLWHPERFRNERIPDRTRALLDWERATLYGLHGLGAGLDLCLVEGVFEVGDYLALFPEEVVPARPEAARALGIAAGDPVYFRARRSFDLWGARYLVLPVRSEGWSTGRNGYASFLADTTRVFADPSDGADWQLVRNRAAYPRAWLVHGALAVAPPVGPRARAERTLELIYQDDLIWHDPRRPVVDLRATALIETDRPGLLSALGAPGPAAPGESVRVTRHEPRRVEIAARLDRPGVVVLADAYYPGWRLTVDGRPAPILRANRMMRGAALTAGAHSLVYTYDPISFRAGLTVSVLALAAVAGRIGLRKMTEFRRPRVE